MTILKSIGIGIAASLVLAACNSPQNTNSSRDIANAERVSDPRLIPVEGTRNLRDLGGYKTADGRTIKHGLIYRSDNLGHLTKTGKAEITALNIAAVTDLRSEPERMEEPDQLPRTDPPIHYNVLPINDDPVDIRALSRKIIKGDIDEAEIMTLLDHRRFITNPDHLKSWGNWLRSLNEDTLTPHLFHCTSGKDRAGYGAAIILLTLGVPKETVMDDFLFSNTVYAGYIDATIKKIERYTIGDSNTDLIRKVMGVNRETLEATFAQMETEYGSIDAFIKKGLGIDDATRTRLQNKFLE